MSKPTEFRELLRRQSENFVHAQEQCYTIWKSQPGQELKMTRKVRPPRGRAFQRMVEQDIQRLKQEIDALAR
ncbi:hypothetical protein [Klebsiella pneumoniae]|uniref:hypothetical protein n=1 Tax=Klebsiella pneumoniae TaxID=573 RepID=UPI0034D36715